MKNCPHCQFLITSDSDTCAVCKLPLETPPPLPAALGASVGAGVGGAPPQQHVPSGTAGAAPVGPGSVGGPPTWSVPGGERSNPVAPGFGAPQAAPPWAQPASAPAGGGFAVAPAPARSKGLVIGIVVAVFVALALVVLGLTFVGTTTDVAQVVPDRWATHDDPAGRFSVDLPGTAVTTNDSQQVPGVGLVTTDVAEVARPTWSSAVVVVDLPPEAPTNVDRPLVAMAEGMFDGVEASGFLDDVVVAGSHDVTASTGPAIEGSLTAAAQDGTAMVGRFRVLQIGADFYAIVTMGPSDRQVDVDDAFDRTVTSFVVPTA